MKMNKYSELLSQLEGLKSSIAKMEYGAQSDNLGYIALELEYLEDRVAKVSKEVSKIQPKSVA